MKVGVDGTRIDGGKDKRPEHQVETAEPKEDKGKDQERPTVLKAEMIEILERPGQPGEEGHSCGQGQKARQQDQKVVHRILIR